MKISPKMGNSYNMDKIGEPVFQVYAIRSIPYQPHKSGNPMPLADYTLNGGITTWVSWTN